MEHSSKSHILIVDDDPAINRMFQLLLKDAGYRVSSATTSEEVIQFLKILVPDAILLDISLPGMDGVELTRRIKSDPSAPFIPIILITALGDMRTKVNGLDAGADDFLVKPVEFAELLARLRVMLRLQQSRRSLQEANRRIEVLLSISQILTSSLDIKQVLNRMVVQLADALGAIRASVILPNGDELPFYASSTREEQDPDLMLRILRDGVAGWVLRSMKPLVLADAHRDQRWTLLGRINDSTRSVLAVPIIHDRTALGTITVVHTRINYFTTEHLELVQTVAAQSAVALDHTQLFQTTTQQKHQLERRSQMLEEMLNIGERLRLNLPLPALLNEIAEAIRRSLIFNLVVIQVFTSPASGEAQGSAGQPREARGNVFTAETITKTVLPLMRERFRVSRSYFIPSGYALDTPSVNLTDSAAPPSLQAAEHLFVPIGTHSHLLGIIAVDTPLDTSTPDLATVQALEVFANQIASAVQNNRLFAREQSRANQMQLLVEIGHNLTELMTPDQLLRLVSALIRHNFGFDTVGVLLLEDDELVLRAAAHGNHASPPIGLRLPIAATLARVMSDQQATATQEVESFCLDYSWADQPILSELAVPLASRDEIQGILVVGSNQSHAFDAVTESLLTAVAAQIVVALDNAQLFAREQAQVQQLSRVNALSVKLTAEQHVEQNFDTVLADIASIFEAPRAALVLFDPEQPSATLAATVPRESRQDQLIPIVAELLTPLVEQRPQLVIPDAVANDPLSRLVLACGMQVGVVAPLPASAQIAGLLLLEPPRRAKDWLASDRNLVQTVANLLAQSIENSQLQQQRMQRLRADMSRYMAPELVEQLLTEGRFGEPTERDVVVIFADLRGFTALSEGLAPRTVVEQVLNRFFALMTDVLYAHEATIDKFLGDGLMAVFGSILPRPDDVSRAVHAAVAMQRAFGDLQAAWNRELGRDIGLGIGISWGRAVVGNLGSPQRLDYTLIGDVVNTASRLVDLAESGQIIVSQHFVDQLPPSERIQLAALSTVILKGKAEKVAIYSVEYRQMIETGG
jgi:adenylate cyclase